MTEHVAVSCKKILTRVFQSSASQSEIVKFIILSFVKAHCQREKGSESDRIREEKSRTMARSVPVPGIPFGIGAALRLFKTRETGRHANR